MCVNTSLFVHDLWMALAKVSVTVICFQPHSSALTYPSKSWSISWGHRYNYFNDLRSWCCSTHTGSGLCHCIGWERHCVHFSQYCQGFVNFWWSVKLLLKMVSLRNRSSDILMGEGSAPLHPVPTALSCTSWMSFMWLLYPPSSNAATKLSNLGGSYIEQD